MAKYVMQFINTAVYEVEIEAESDDEAYEITKEWGRDELEDSEISNHWEIEVHEVG